MPDPTFKTVSASQIAALWNQSPYLTRWMLWHNFAEGVDVDNEENDRMAWGKRLERPILEATADELRLEVKPYNIYERRGPIGCTRDAIVYDPQRGLGAAEGKNVDYGRWKETWTETTAPPHIELQLQAQMYVGDGKEPFRWGVISALVGGNDLKIHMREPMPELWAQMEAEATAFLASVAAGDEPEAFGSKREFPLLDMLYPKVEPEKVVDLRGTPEGEDMADVAREWLRAGGQRRFYTKLEDQAKARLLGTAKDASKIQLPGVVVEIAKSETQASTVTLPDALNRDLQAVIDDWQFDPDDRAVIEKAMEFEQVTRKAGVRTTIKVAELTPRVDPFGMDKQELYELARKAQAPLDQEN